MLFAIRVFQAINLFFILSSFISKRIRSRNSWNYLRISDWVFYFCGIVSFSLSFGCAAILEDNDSSQYATCLLFAVACITGMVIMFVQKIWRIKYNSDILIFRNSFGFSKEYRINQLTLIEDKRFSRIIHNGNTVVKWDSSIMNTAEDISIHKHLCK